MVNPTTHPKLSAGDREILRTIYESTYGEHATYRNVPDYVLTANPGQLRRLMDLGFIERHDTGHVRVAPDKSWRATVWGYRLTAAGIGMVEGVIENKPTVLIDPADHALAVLFKEPEISPTELANRVGVKRSTLYSRAPKWKHVRQTLTARDAAQVTRGRKTADSLEAHAEYREFHPTDE